MRKELHGAFDKLWRHSTVHQRVLVGFALMLAGSYLAHLHVGAPEVLQEAFAWGIHALGFERLAAIIPE